jgi:general secretion pathway protein B
MSYILDALKKAEADRGRGAVPGLSSVQTNHSTYIHYGSQRRSAWQLLLVLCLLLLVALVLWLWLGRTPAAEVAAPPPQVARAAVAPTPTPTPTPVKPVPALPSANVMPSVRAVAPLGAQALPTAPNPVASGAAPVTAMPAEPIVKALPAPVNPARAAPTGIPLLSELPDSLRRQLPALNISGALYSDAPPEWTLIINDQLLGRGGQIAPDLRLEEISASSALFNFKGHRFRVDR